jgi:CubicO group peptidase (beta-lactamase class C family)
MTGKDTFDHMTRGEARRRSGRNLLILPPLAFALLLQACSPQRAGEDRFSEIRSDILEFMEDENVPSIAVAVAQDGRIVWEEGFGWANREDHIKATPHTPYELASIAKVFTTNGLMVLRERGLLDFDSPVASYLDDIRIQAFGVDPSGVTLRRIIQHTSGLPMYWGEPFRSDTLEPFTRKELLQRYAVLALPPGERELYSNLGVSMAVHVLEKTSGRDFGDFLEREVFSPLGMSNTFYLSAPDTSRGCAQQYTKEGQRWHYRGGMYSSAHDLVRFCMFHLKDHLPEQTPILSDSSIELMQTSIDPASDYRLPWWVWEYRGFCALVFTGASGTIIALAPEADLAIVVLANRLQADTPRICRWIADAMLHDFDESRRLPTGVRTHRKVRPAPLSRSGLTGIWRGEIRAGVRVISVELDCPGSGLPRMRATDGIGLWTNWSEPIPSLRGDYSGGIFSAHFPVRIPVEDTRGHDHWTWVYVGQKGDTLQGYAVAHAADGPYFGLPYCITLVRERPAGVY